MLQIIKPIKFFNTTATWEKRTFFSLQFLVYKLFEEKIYSKFTNKWFWGRAERSLHKGTFLVDFIKIYLIHDGKSNLNKLKL